MASFLSVVSLLVLVLATGCFTLPVLEQYSTSTIRPLSELELTTGSVDIDGKDKISMRLISEEDSTNIPDIHGAHPTSDSHLQWEMSTPAYHEQNVKVMSHLPREVTSEATEVVDEQDERSSEHYSVTFSPETMTTDAPHSSLLRQQRGQDLDSYTTAESMTYEREQHPRQSDDDDNNNDDIRPKYPDVLDRSVHDNEHMELEMTTGDEMHPRGAEDQEQGADNNEQAERGVEDQEQTQQGGETNEQAERGIENNEQAQQDGQNNEQAERGVEDQEQVQQDGQNTEQAQRGFEDQEQDGDNNEQAERGVEENEQAQQGGESNEQAERGMPLFTETSSTVAPHLYTSEPSESSVHSFGKYTGLLADEPREPKKIVKVESPKKYNTQTRLSTPSTIVKDESDEESMAPIAQLDQVSSEHVPNIKSHNLQLEDNEEVSVAPQKFSTSTVRNQRVQVQQEALAQGEQPVPFKKTKSSN